MTVVDATNAILGRLASKVAKRLLNGEQIDIINAEKAVLTGNAQNVHLKYKTRFGLHPKGNPHYGPKFSRMPHMIVKTAIRGMLPWKQSKGKVAFKLLKVHIGVPEGMASDGTQKIKEAEHPHEKGFVVIEEVSRKLGAKW